MAYRSVEVANEFLRLPGAAAILTQMQLQKLTYIAHGWNWVINEDPLVSDQAEAWSFGPVYRDLYDHTKFFGRAPIGRPITPDDDEISRFFAPPDKKMRPPYAADLTQREKEVVRHVWNRYGNLSAIKLSELTHQPNTPWFKAFKRGRNSVLLEEDIKRHYQELAERAEKAA